MAVSAIVTFKKQEKAQAASKHYPERSRSDFPPLRPSVTAGAIDIDAEILGVNLEVLLFGLWENCDGSSTSVDAALALCYRDALNAVDATFKL